MSALSDDDLNLRELDDAELARAWDLWFDLAQHTNDSDPPWTHGVFLLCEYPTDSGQGIPIDQPQSPPG